MKSFISPSMKLMSIESYVTARAVVFRAPEGTTLQEVLERVIPHMGPDRDLASTDHLPSNGPRFRDALVKAGFELVPVESYDLKELVDSKFWPNPNDVGDLDLVRATLRAAKEPKRRAG